MLRSRGVLGGIVVAAMEAALVAFSPAVARAEDLPVTQPNRIRRSHPP